MLGTSQLTNVALNILGKYKGGLGEIAIWESERTGNRLYREGEISKAKAQRPERVASHYQRFTSEVDDGR